MAESKDDRDAEMANYEGGYKPTFHDFYQLMRFKVTKILLVSSFYDAFILEEEGLLTEQISGEYQDLALTSPPQIVRVRSGREALSELRLGRYDLIITMSHISDLDPYEFGKKAKEIKEDIPVVLLATDPGALSIFHKPGGAAGIDKVFYWTGDAALFLAITKYVEDRANIEADTEHGVVKAVLVIEDSPVDYSGFLPIIYTEIMKQTQALIAVGLNEQEKWFRKKARPKILLAETYEEGKELYDRYRKHLLGIITDVSYRRGDRLQDDAGFEFVEEIVDQGIPVLIQSSQPEHRKRADRLKVPFFYKRSETPSQDLRDFLKERLGFGDFVFAMPDGKQIARARDISEFVEIVQQVPLESVRYHATRNDFSRWLMARGEIALAMELKPRKVSDFKNDEEMTRWLLTAIKESRQEKRLGVITDFSQEDFEFEQTFTRLGGGSLGGKGRGLAFLAALLHQSGIRNRFRDLRVRLPDTLVIGTDVFDRFMDENNLYEVVNRDLSDREVCEHFAAARVPEDIKSSLGIFLSRVSEPLAVRSSSLLEDSQNQPFAGVYATYMLPNNCGDQPLRLDQLCQAIKLVYASTFSKSAKAYVHTTVHRAEEKMAVVIQKLVGRRYGDSFYPVYSGVGQSYNFYPVAPLKREDGIVSVALGLGKIVIEGGKVLSFSPVHPEILPGPAAPEEILKSTQNRFYALDLRNACFDLAEGEEATLNLLDVSDADRNGTLDYLASTYDADDDRLRDGTGFRGPRVITFAGILKYKALPLVEVISELLRLGERGMGRPVEIEFAGTTGDDGEQEFYLLQIRPLVTLRERRQVAIEPDETKNALVSTDRALGNGVLDGLRDVILVVPETFDSLKTVEIAAEIGEINRKLDGTPYILIGPGRWGTRDRFLGIPVAWDQISGARTIIEVALEDFRVDPSHGTHFFHNITSLGIMYLTVPYGHEESFIDWNRLGSAATCEAGRYVKHVRFDLPLTVKVDGRTGRGVIRPSG
jgi:hypothetical protein